VDVVSRRTDGDLPDRPDRRERRGVVVARSFRATPSSGIAIRSFVRDALRVRRLADDIVADVQLVVSELAANAIEHGAGDDLAVEVDASHHRFLEVSVTCVSDAAPALRAWRTWAIASPDARSGRGLGIVSTLMDDIDVEARNDRMTVRCRRRLAPADRR
jgi:anti-sigma regulatory factor (Ser/Thr protein kinase)